MTSILISADFKEVGEDLARRLTKDLGYKHLGPSFLETVADRYKTPTAKLAKALGEGSASRSLLSKSTEQNLAYIQAAVTDALLEDSIVCQGLAAHLYVRDVSHILKIRLLGDQSTREETITKRDSIAPRKAQKIIAKEDSTRVRWSVKTFGIDESDASLYDMVLSVGQMGLAKAAEVAANMANYRKFKPNTYSKKCLSDLALAQKLKVLLLAQFSDFRVVADGGTVQVFIKCSKRQKAKTAGEIKVIANDIPEIKFVEVHAVSKLVDEKQKENV